MCFKKGKSFAGWKDMFSLGGGTQMLPKHILQGKDYNTVWNNGGFDTHVPFIGTGPFLLKSYSPESTTLVPEPEVLGQVAHGKGGPFIAIDHHQLRPRQHGRGHGDQVG